MGEDNEILNEFSPQNQLHRETGIQTDVTSEYIVKLKLENVNLPKELENKLLRREAFESSDREMNDRKIKYYTGLPNPTSFILIVDHISSFLTEIRVSKLTNF